MSTAIEWMNQKLGVNTPDVLMGSDSDDSNLTLIQEGQVVESMTTQEDLLPPKSSRTIICDITWGDIEQVKNTLSALVAAKMEPIRSVVDRLKEEKGVEPVQLTLEEGFPEVIKTMRKGYSVLTEDPEDPNSPPYAIDCQTRGVIYVSPKYKSGITRLVKHRELPDPNNSQELEEIEKVIKQDLQNLFGNEIVEYLVFRDPATLIDQIKDSGVASDQYQLLGDNINYTEEFMSDSKFVDQQPENTYKNIISFLNNGNETDSNVNKQLQQVSDPEEAVKARSMFIKPVSISPEPTNQAVSNLNSLESTPSEISHPNRNVLSEEDQKQRFNMIFGKRQAA